MWLLVKIESFEHMVETHHEPHYDTLETRDPDARERELLRPAARTSSRSP